MSDSTELEKGERSRCPKCDSVIDSADERCLMCGEPLTEVESSGSLTELNASEPNDTAREVISDTGEIPQSQYLGEGGDSIEEAADSEEPEAVKSVMVEKQSRITLVLAFIAFIIIALLGVLVLRFPTSAEVSFIPTETALAPTITYTPSWTPLPADQAVSESTSTVTPVTTASETPQAPRAHSVSAGETMFGLGLRYDVSSQSIAAANGLAPDAGLVVSQQLLIPWPTATPPLEPVVVEVSGQTIIADPTDCSMYEIKGGDTLLGVASRNRVDFRALLAVNRLTDQSILQPGDEICIPRIIRSGVLPPTPGPSPTPTNTPPPAGPHILLPLPEANIGLSEEPFALQWVAVKDLDENEWYMVEMTDLSSVDSHPLRAFSRQTSFLVPKEWRPDDDETHQFRWQIAIVKVTGHREDGQFIYTFGGASSEEGSFYWAGTVPTATRPVPTDTPTPAISSDNNGF